jgi:DNA polymerase
MVEKVSQEWSKRTRMELEYERYTSVFQKDVNNYLIVPEGDLYYESGMPAWKAKGAWAKPWYKEVKIDGKKTKVEDYIEYDSVILKKALHNYFVLGIPVEQTINECDRLIEFQKIVMISSKYSYALHGDQIVRDKHLRVFASTNEQDGGIFKLHAIKKNLNKASDTPVHAFIVNDNIEDAKASDYPLDKQYYINMANDRVKKFVKKEKVS